jgi:WD40 repeat protein
MYYTRVRGPRPLMARVSWLQYSRVILINRYLSLYLAFILVAICISCNPHYRRSAIVKCSSRHWEQVEQLEFLSDGRAIVSAAGNFIYARDIEKGNDVFMSMHYEDVICFALSKDQLYFFSSGKEDNTIHLSKTGGVMLKKLTGHSNFVNKMVVSIGNDYLITAGYDHFIRCWSIPQGTAYASVPTTGYLTRSMSIDQDKNNLLVLSADGMITTYSIPDLIKINCISTGLQSASYGVLSATSHYAFLISYNNTPYVYNTNTTEYHKLNINFRKSIYAACFAKDDSYLYIGSSDKTINEISLSTFTVTSRLKGHKYPISSICISNYNDLLGSGDTKGNVVIWNLRSKSIKSILAAEFVSSVFPTIN